MASTFRMDAVTDHLLTFLTAQMGTLGINFIQYGGDPVDGGIPQTPAVIIEPGRKIRELNNTGHQTVNRFEIAIFVYDTSLSGVEAIQQSADTLTENIETAVNTEALTAADGGTKFGDLLTHGYVTSVDYSFDETDDGVMRVNRLIFFGISKTRLI